MELDDESASSFYSSLILRDVCDTARMCARVNTFSESLKRIG